MDSDERSADPIGERMKTYERSSESQIDQTKPVIARIDGHKFSKFTKGFKRPFDDRLHETMRLTTEDLLTQFNAYLGYTESDEITLIFHECDEEKRQEFIFSGRTQKLSSLLASYATARFNFHLMKQDFSKDDILLRKVSMMTAHFDARVFNVPDRNEALNNLIWFV
jgi:tRNA(His) guanylyltransferase